MIIIIDRIEEGIAVAELPDGTFVSVTPQLLEGCKEGLAYEIKQVQTDAGKTVRKLMDEVWDDGK